MDEAARIALAVTYAYLLGSVSPAYLVGRFVAGVDLRNVGSGTVGASNVWHNVGRWWIFPVGIFDLFAKGLTPVLVAQSLGLDIEWQALAGCLTIVGHNWPVFLGFRGGRGIVPTLGVLLALARIELALFVVVALIGWRLTNSAAVWVLIGILLLPAWSWALGHSAAHIVLMGSIAALTVGKRLTANAGGQSQAGLGRLLWNRLAYDRDISNHDAWVQRSSNGDPCRRRKSDGV